MTGTNVVSLSEFIEKHGKALGEKIECDMTPVYLPGRPDSIADAFNEQIDELLRSPFPVQREVIKGLSKALYHQNRNRLFICGEMGTGKTLLACSIIAMSPKPIRAIVCCPGHLVQKWIREAQQTISNVVTYDLAVRNAISLLESLRYEKTSLKNHEIWVISQERLKLGFGWEPAYNLTKRSTSPRCPSCGEIPRTKDDEWLSISVLKKKKSCCHCGEALWRATPDPRRFAPMEYIKKYLKGKFTLAVIDEIHMSKAGHSLNGHSMGILAASFPKFIGLTGTLTGGYADSLFYLLYRLEPHRLKNFGYSGVEKWQRAYGVIEEIQELDDSDHRYGRIKQKNVIIRKKPGISPEVVGRFFLDKSCFLRLGDVLDGLPPYNESVVTIEMDDGQRGPYKKLESDLRDAVRRYKTKACGAMLQALLSYPDSCVSFPEDIVIKSNDGELERITAPQIDGDSLLPKEKELIEIIRNEKSQGRKTLVYVTFTGSRDIRPRIKKVIEAKGFTAGILHESIEPKKREAWINQHSHKYDVLITNAELVKIGLDMYNFPTIVFYQSGYNIYSLRQAARRSWRIGQREPVRVYYLTYGDTMQSIAIGLIARKMEVSLLTEGELPEGIAEYQIEGGSMIQELTKALVEGRQYSGAEVAWANLRKKEIELNLGIRQTEKEFSNASVPRKKTVEKSTVINSTLIQVTVFEGKRKKSAKLTVQYGELEEVLQGKVAQFALF